MITSEAAPALDVTSRPIVTEAHMDAYERDGAVCVRGVLPPDQVEFLRDENEAALARKGDGYRDNTALANGRSGRFAHTFRMSLASEALREFASTTILVEVAATLMRSEKVNLFFDQSFVKEPNTSERTPWHNDMPFWPLLGHQVCSIWVALDAVSRASGAVEYVAGSHLWNRWFRPRSFSGDNEHGHNPGYEPVPDVDADRGMYDILSWEMEAGDVIAFHGMTLHGSPGNATSDRRRRGYCVRYTGDDVVYAPWPGMVTPLLNDDLVPGEPIDSVHHPVVRQPA